MAVDKNSLEKPGDFYKTIPFAAVSDLKKPTWAEMLSSLERAAYVNVGDYLCFRRVDFVVATPRGYEIRKAISCTPVGISHKNELFSYTERGYNSAWDYVITMVDEIQTYLRFHKKKTRNAEVKHSPVEKIYVVEKESDYLDPKKDPEFLQWKKEAFEYAIDKLSVPKEEKEKFNNGAYEDVLFDMWKFSFHWMDASVYLAEGGLGGDQLAHEIDLAKKKAKKEDKERKRKEKLRRLKAQQKAAEQAGQTADNIEDKKEQTDGTENV